MCTCTVRHDHTESLKVRSLLPQGPRGASGVVIGTVQKSPRQSDTAGLARGSFGVQWPKKPHLMLGIHLGTHKPFVSDSSPWKKSSL